MRASKHEELLDLIIEIARLIAEADKVGLNSLRLKRLAETLDPETESAMLETLEIKLGTIKRTASEMLEVIDSFREKLKKIKEPEISDAQVKASQLLITIQKMIDSNEHGVDFDNRLRAVTEEYLSLRKESLRSKSARTGAHNLALKARLGNKRTN